MAGKMSRINSLTRAEASGRIGEVVRTMAERFGEKPDSLLHTEFGKMKDKDAPLPLSGIPSLLNTGLTISLWQERFPGSVAREISSAEEIAAGRIPVFSGMVDHRGGIDWHLDSKSGRRVPLEFYRDIDTLEPSVVGDVKHIWEINRCNFLVSLGRAYGATRKREFYEAWRNTVSSWIAANPYNRGVNWASSLELAFRAVNWLWSASLFSAELEEDAEMRERLMLSLYLHGRHIERHISYFFSPNTHLTGEALGLLYIGKAYPCISDADQWIETAEDILETELRRQILPDGGYFEMATWYHKYTIDFYLNYLILSSRPNDETISIVRRTVRHLALLAAPDGTVPLLGDSDGGRLLFLSPSKADIRGACCVAATLLKDGELKYLCGGGFEEEALWLLGNKGAEQFDRLEPVDPESFHSINEDTGLYCFRTGMSPDDTALLIDCGPHGWKKCGHAHADLLSFVLYGRGEPVIADPGTFTYSGSKLIRDESRGSQRHNTISINDLSQSVPGGTFDWLSRAAPGRTHCFTGGDLALLGSVGCLDTRTGGRIARVVYFLGERLIALFDFIDGGEKPFSFLSNLQFGTGQLEELGDGFFRFSGEREKYHIRVLSSPGSRFEISYADIYPDYDLAVKAPRLRLTQCDITETATVTTVIGVDRELVEGIYSSDNGSIASSTAGVSVNIRTRIDDMDMDKFHMEASAVFSEGDRTQVLLSHSGIAIDADGRTVFEMKEKPGFVSAVIEDGAVNLSAGELFSPMRFSRLVDKIFLDGEKVSFRSKDRWIELDRDPVEGK